MAKKITAIATQKKAGRFNIYLDGFDQISSR